jgi:Carboxypeptidase regulatory-like domain
MPLSAGDKLGPFYLRLQGEGMNHVKFARLIFPVFAVLVQMSSMASAQSTISGQVKDTSGAGMSGVRVEAASPALIEKSRTATTSGDGRYTIVDVRPGTYTMTFTIEGFTTVKQQVEVPSSVTAPVDADMKVGSARETITVEATVATVDVQNVAHPQTLSRNYMDSVPTVRNVQSVGSYMPGVHLNIPDVGGSQQTQQTFMATHGNPAQHDVTLFDGMLINLMQGDGQAQIPLDNEMIQEATYFTSSNPVDSTAGGVFVDIVPKDGGNDFHGEVFGAYIPSRFVGSNLDSALTARGIAAQPKVKQIQDFDGSLGGPIKRDKLWFLFSGRKQLTYQQSPLCQNTDGAPAWIKPTFTPPICA